MTTEEFDQKLREIDKRYARTMEEIEKTRSETIESHREQVLKLFKQFGNLEKN